ncbi:TonB protein C-terminal [Mariniphaga anaerophila]|uniref:TonB protein C-terminal n=1 Tax=Mariniphaga anaerophila TaxID=1484053 RepID=A0A1M5E7X3_9BACT|nr:energy transducer TonB [Mariniphaga anaerophila]SHF75317.1 TonB protein C-terminal [Mariniphaga anaerophila]
MKKIILVTILLAVSHVLFSREKTECDTTTYFVVPQMPLYFGDYDTFLDNVSEQIDAKTKSVLKSSNTYIGFRVTCNGEAVITSTNSELTQFYKILENELNKFRWIPGRHRGKSVNVQITTSVRMANNKLDIPIKCKRVKGELFKCKITDEKSGTPVSNVRLTAKYNDCFYLSDQNGEIEFYCDAKDEIEISHINYQSFSFNAPENTSSFQIKLTNIVYELETVDLTQHFPKKLPFKKSVCNFQDWQEPRQNQLAVFKVEDFFVSEMAVFNGGYECLDNYTAQEFVLPKIAFENGYADTVNVSFTVAEDGKLKNVAFSKALNYGVDAALEKLFYEMPKWKPATQARQKSEQTFTIKLIIGVNKYWEKYYR